MKKILFISAISFSLLMPLSVAAQTVSSSPSPSPIKTRGEIRNEINEQKKEAKGEVEQIRNDLKNRVGQIENNLKTNIANIKNLVARIVQGQVASISGTTLIVTQNNKTYTVNTDSNTKFRRHFWGQSSLSEISAGDKVNVWGKFTDDTKATILATMIRDTSIQKRKGVFFGTVSVKTSTTLVIDTLGRGAQTVYFDSSTKFVNRKEQSMTAGQVNVGDKIRVKGVWDKNLSKITEVTQVKDFTQPVVTTVTPSPTLTPTPTP